MPLAVRYVEPRSVCSNPLLSEEATRAGDALQAVAVRSMAGLIRQLGSLARHAESVMGELAENLASCHARTVELEKRTRILVVDILPNLDPDREVLEGFEIPHPDLQFKSDVTMDQRLLSQRHAPPALLEQYNQAKAPPALNEFDEDWEDGRNALHLYSKPDFFFQNWREEIQRQTLKKMSQMEITSPTQESRSGKALQRPTKYKQTLDNSTGSDRVSSFSRPVKRTFSLSRKPQSHGKSVHGSWNSLDKEPRYSTMPSQHVRPGLPRRSSPSFHSVRHYPPSSNSTVMRTQSLRAKPKKRPKLYSLTKTTGSVYMEQKLDMVIPNTTLEESGEHERNSSIRRSNSFRRSKSKSPASNSSFLGSMHVHTVAEELARRERSPFTRLPKHYHQQLDLGSTSFETYLAIDMPKKSQTTFRTPVGIRQRPVSALDMQLVAMRNDSTAALRTSTRLKHISTEVAAQDENQVNFTVGAGPLSNGSLVPLRKRTSLLSSSAKARPVSASFIDPPTVKKIQAASQHVHGGSLTDLMTTNMMRPDSPMSKYRPKRPAPQAPSSRPSSRNSMNETPNSGRSTPKSLPIHKPLSARHSDPNSLSSSTSTLTGTPPVIPNGRVTPNSPIVANHRNSPIQHNTNSPQLPMIPIQENEMMTSVNQVSRDEIPNTPTVSIPEIITSPARTGHHLYARQDSLYISPRKQSLTINAIDKSQLLRASQILMTGGITEGDLSSSRMDLLAAIRKGIQLKEVQKKEEQKNNLASMPWDVAAILERRLVLEMDTDSSEEDINDEEWEDD